MGRYKPLLPIAMIFIVLLTLEICLEIRHYFRCFDTPIFGQHECGVTGAGSEDGEGDRDPLTSMATTTYGPVQGWPYRSEVPQTDLTDKFIIWIASASHAEHSRLSAETIFPNQICSNTDIERHCIVINGSRAGNNIPVNLNTLENSIIEREPDVAILYQMATYIADAQKNQPKSSKNEQKAVNTAFSYHDVRSALVKHMQRTSLYLHLSEYIGSNIKLSGFRSQRIDRVEEQFLEYVDMFVSYCRSKNITPILTSFATAYDQNNIGTANTSMMRTLMRQNRDLSPTGYVNTVAELNKAVVLYARRENVQLIKLAEAIGGKPEYFVDMVHFNSLGHSVVASTIANALNPNIIQRK